MPSGPPLAGAQRMLGASPAFLAALALVERFAPLRHPLLLLGESGTGKTDAARLAHAKSGRAGKFFRWTPPNPEIAAAELFGAERGAYTGATKTTDGLLALARGGTLFLDEVADLPANLQRDLLEYLDTGEYSRLGGREKLRSDARIVAATWKPLDSLRPDLRSRLDVLVVTMPALRERPGDAALIAEGHLGRELSDLEHDLVESQPWPENVRSLLNALERASALANPKPFVDALHESIHLARPRPDMGRAQNGPAHNGPPSRCGFILSLVKAVRARGVQEVSAAAGYTARALRKKLSGERRMTEDDIARLESALGLEIRID